MMQISGCLAELLSCIKEEQHAKERYTGYDWGYHGHLYASRREEAEQDFMKTLQAIIDERVNAALAKEMLK